MTISTSRVKSHRARLSKAGLKRVELTVPEGDVELVCRLAVHLRDDRETTSPLRDQLRASLSKPALTGEELVAFFRASPLIEADLIIERDRSPGRVAEV